MSDAGAGSSQRGRDLQAADARAMERARHGWSRAWAPGRCTILGEHVDYAGGLVLCCAVDIGVAVQVRASADGRWRVLSGADTVERPEPSMAGDIGDRPFAATLALGQVGIRPEPLDILVVASLPRAAGLSSSAALVCATAAAVMARHGVRLPASRLAQLAFTAEHDIVGVPCGEMDYRAVVQSPESGVMLLDCRDGSARTVAWPWLDLVLVACHSGAVHSVNGSEYRARRADAEQLLRILGHHTTQDLTEVDVASLDGRLRRRARHLFTETARVREGVEALRAGDAPWLGSLMSASHQSLRDDCEVSTPALDAMVDAATSVDGCLGARLVGAGFGGCVVALCTTASASRCGALMSCAAGRTNHGWTWELTPGPGLAALSPELLSI